MAKSRQKKYVTLIMISSVLQPTHSPMCFSPQNRLDERWGAETSAKGTRFNITIDTPPGVACPGQYHGTGATCYEALAAAVQLYYASAHAYPATQAATY